MQLCESFDLLIEATEHERKYPSQADDSSTSTRRVQFILTRVLNKLNNLIEISDTQAVAGLMRFDAGQCSEIFWVYDSRSMENFMIDEKYPRAEEEPVPEQSEEESLCDSDSLHDFVESNEEDMPAKKDSLDTEMGDAIDNGDERSISASVYDMDETEWLEKTNAAEMLACEASNETTLVDQWSDLDSSLCDSDSLHDFDESNKEDMLAKKDSLEWNDHDSFDKGERGEKVDAPRKTNTSQVCDDDLVELKREDLNDTRLYVSSDKPIGVPNINHSFCYIASALQMLRDHTHEILSSPHEFRVLACDEVMGRGRVIANMHTLFKGVIACLHLNNSVGFVRILEAFFAAAELERGNKDVTEFWDAYILPSLRSIGLGDLFDVRTTSVIEGWNAEIGIQRREVTNTATGWIAVPVSESVQVGLDKIIGCARDKQDWIGPSYDDALPEGGEPSLSASELDALRLQHRTHMAQEVEFIPDSAKSLVVKINRQVQFQGEKITDVMEVEQVCDSFLSRDDGPLTAFVFLCLLIRPFNLG